MYIESSNSTSTSYEALLYWTVLWTYLPVLLCILTSTVARARVFFFHVNTHCPFMYFIGTEYLVGCVDLICSLYSWWKDFQSSSLAILPLELNCSFIPTTTCRLSTGVYS